MLEGKLKILKKYLSCDKNDEEYHKCKADLHEIYDNIAEWLKIRSSCMKVWRKWKINKVFP